MQNKFPGRLQAEAANTLLEHALASNCSAAPGYAYEQQKGGKRQCIQASVPGRVALRTAEWPPMCLC